MSAPPLRQLSGKPISRLGIGCSRIGSFNNDTPIAETRVMLAEALDLGVTVFDTANIYGQGDSERELGRLLKGRSEQAFVVTKLGKRFSMKMRLLRPVKPLIKAVLPKGGRAAVTQARDSSMDPDDYRPETFAPTLKASLRRLGMDCIDGLMLHGPRAPVLSDGAVPEALAGLAKQGLVRHWGVSVDTEEELRLALAMPGLSILQIPLDLIEAIAGSPLEQAVRACGAVVFAREVMRFQPDLSPPQAVARAATFPIIDCVLAGVSSRKHMRELVATIRS
ncbi:aldo/keto reductase [Caulobacter sp.]|uniref:aldo/keto reductase n=1 Tax=Caulobacter sp. TaxID=78 RepID=UPI003BAAD744